MYIKYTAIWDHCDDGKNAGKYFLEYITLKVDSQRSILVVILNLSLYFLHGFVELCIYGEICIGEKNVFSYTKV